MGKPYDLELQQLHTTYRWAMKTSVDRLARSLLSAGSFPLVAVGSGGSFTTADFAASLHRNFSSKLASAITPMDAAVPSLDLRRMAVFLATAGGKNPDVLDGFRGLAIREPRRFTVLCTSVGSPLARLGTQYPFVDFIEVKIPSGKDGFLATNSLLASTILLERAYNEAFGAICLLPPNLSALFRTDSPKEFTEDLDRNCMPLWQKETLVVLHSPTCRSAAIDLESKFTEAALGNVQVSDYRHFAHGRHHWLAKHPETTAILAFITPDDEKIASKTLDLIPADIPVFRVDVPFVGSIAGIAALVRGLHIVGSAGRARSINPGRPGVPAFGRRIYHLKASPAASRFDPSMSPDEVVAIERKSGMLVGVLERLGELLFWRKAYATYTQRLMKAEFQAVVFDYDGTLCDEADREKGLSAPVLCELKRLLRGGAMIGFATGRGKSVKKALQKHIQKKYQSRVVIGYYNGGDIGCLDDNSHPDGSDRVIDDLIPITKAIQSHEMLSRFVECECRLPQIKVMPKSDAPVDLVWRLLQQVVYGLAIPGVTVVGSSHSMDVLAPKVSKRIVVDAVITKLGCENDSILCIGDHGQWPGNDYCLLNGPYALSVDEVSQDPDTCWNLAPPGLRGTCAAITYLSQLRVRKGKIHMFLQAPVKRKK